MLKLIKIPFKVAANAMLILLSLVVLFHLLVLFQVLPTTIIWGGKFHDPHQLQILELVSIVVNSLLIVVILLKIRYISSGDSTKAINIFLWFFCLLFCLNTIGNLFAESNIEKIIFTPLTLISAVLCYNIAKE